MLNSFSHKETVFGFYSSDKIHPDMNWFIACRISLTPQHSQRPNNYAAYK